MDEQRCQMISELIRGIRIAMELRDQIPSPTTNPTSKDGQALDGSLLEKMFSCFDKAISMAKLTWIELPEQEPPLKRRREEAVTIKLANSVDDGYAWRKYGEKCILNNKHLRSYYRCTHKLDRGCQATKQVQRTDENQTNYRVTYIGQHTCESILKNPIDLLDPDNPAEKDSSILLSFRTNKSASKHGSNPNFPLGLSTTSGITSGMVRTGVPVNHEIPSMLGDPHQGAYSLFSSSSVCDSNLVEPSNARLDADYLWPDFC